MHTKKTEMTVNTILLVGDRWFLRIMYERTLARSGCCLVTACDGDHALGLARESVPALIFLDMFAAKVDKTAGSSITSDSPTNRPSFHYCEQQPSPEQRASIEKGRHYSLLRQIETRTAPTFGISDSDREANIELTDRGRRRCRTPKPRSSYAAGENEI